MAVPDPDPAAEDGIRAAALVGGRLLPGASHDRVPWWSLTKTLIATLVMRRVAAGELRLGDPLDDPLLPGPPVTLAAVLSHRAGLPDYGGLPAYSAAVAAGADAWTVEELFRHVPPAPGPGGGFRYSNIGYLFLRRCLERRTGRPLADLARDEVFVPLGLSARLARGRADMADTVFAGGQDYDPGWVFHGLAVGPVSEAARLLAALLDGALLPLPRVARMRAAAPVPGPFPGRIWEEGGYGLGLMCGRARGGVPLVGHGASGPGSNGAIYRMGAVTVAAFGPVPEGVLERRVQALALAGAAP